MDPFHQILTMTRECALNGEVVSAQTKGEISHCTLYCPSPRRLDESDAVHRKHKEKSQSLHLVAEEIIVFCATCWHLFAQPHKVLITNYNVESLSLKG